MPFWSTFFRALGYDVIMSYKSSRAMFEDGLSFVPSDTVCFPAKLAHGHIHDFVHQAEELNLDETSFRIFMPMIMEMPPADRDKKRNYVCAVVKGYPFIILILKILRADGTFLLTIRCSIGIQKMTENARF